jgi:hypothetical protein
MVEISDVAADGGMIHALLTIGNVSRDSASIDPLISRKEKNNENEDSGS